MKIEKAKTITIIVLSVLLAMSIFTQVLFFTLLGIRSTEDFKRAMLANELLTGFGNATPDDSASMPSETTPVTAPTTEPAEHTNSTVAPVQPSAPVVVLDAAGLKVTFLAVEFDDLWQSYKLKFMLENNSDIDVSINSLEEVIDGFMVDVNIGFYCEVLAGKKAVDYLILYDFELEPLGISKPNTIELKWSATASDDIFNTITKTDAVTINIT